MEGPQIAFLVLLLALTSYLGNRLWATINGPSYKERILRLATADQQLSNHTSEFARPEILQVSLCLKRYWNSKYTLVHVFLQP